MFSVLKQIGLEECAKRINDLATAAKVKAGLDPSTKLHALVNTLLPFLIIFAETRDPFVTKCLAGSDIIRR